MRSQRTISILLASAAGVVVLLPTLRMGFMRDDWLLLWSRLDPATVPAGATGVFYRPIGEAWWGLAVGLFGDAAFGAHLLQFSCGALLLLCLWRLARQLGAEATAGAFFVAIVGLHVALLELRLWAAATNGLLALLFACAALGFSLCGRRWLSLVLFLLALGARADAVLLFPLTLALSAWRGGRTPKRTVTVAIGALSIAILALSLSTASTGLAWRPENVGRALRLLILPWGTPLPASVQAAFGIVASALVVATMWLRPVRAHHRWILVCVLAVAWAGSLMPWNMAGRYLAFGVFGLGLLVLFDPPRRGWSRLALLLWLAAHLASGVAGNTTRDLLRRSRAESELYRIVQSSQDEILSVSLIDPPPMGWTDSEADAENVVSAARRKLIPVRFASTGETSESNELRLRHADGVWRRDALREDPAEYP